MNIPSELKYSKDHEWINIVGDTAFIGITDYAQGELGDIVFIDCDSEGETLNAGEVFGTIEAVKTVSDLYMPTNGKVIEINPVSQDSPEAINHDPYKNWIIKIQIIGDISDNLLSAEEYQNLIS